MGIDGVLVVLSWDVVSSGIAGHLLREKVPVVGVAGARPAPGIDGFVTDDEGAGDLAGCYLLGMGHRALAFVGAADSETTRLRYAGLTRALRGAGLCPDPRLLVEVGGYAQHDAYAGVVHLITRNVPFTAVVAFNDVMALGVLNALEDQGLHVPGRVSVVGFDDTTSEYARPKMTTVACPKEALGVRGVRQLLARIRGDDSPPATHLLPPALIVRQSTQVPPGSTGPMGVRERGRLGQPREGASGCPPRR